MSEKTNYLSPKNFAKMVSGGKNFIPSKIKKELKDAGMNHLFSGGKIKEYQAVKALRHLKGKNLLNTSKRTGEIYNQAAQQQFQQDLEADLAEKQKHIRTNIMMDISEELDAEHQGESAFNYDPRSVLGQGRLVDEIRRDQEKRQQESKAELEKKGKLSRAKNGSNKKPPAIDLKKLPDMGIDFGE